MTADAADRSETEHTGRPLQALKQRQGALGERVERDAPQVFKTIGEIKVEDAELSKKLLMDWTHWDWETHKLAIQKWSALNRASAAHEDETDDGREFKRLTENLDAFDEWWNQHDMPPVPSSPFVIELDPSVHEQTAQWRKEILEGAVKKSKRSKKSEGS